MGTSGNNPGYKVFSINTTIRNPSRNSEFLEVLSEFNNRVLTPEVKNLIYIKLIKKGIYKLRNIPNEIKTKYELGQELEEEEIEDLITNNPQKTGDEGRVMTQIRALKDTGLLSFFKTNNKLYLMKINSLGLALIKDENIENIYTKAMLGLHANNPQRITIYNKSRPFLNLLFIINELNNYYKNEKGILWHEFAFFVLPMKDCNYKNAASEIIKYRNIFRNNINKYYLENYLFNKLKINKIKFKSILDDYPDDVFRKFYMTGLIEKHGFKENTYIRFNNYNKSKVDILLNEYKNFNFINFENTEKYENYIINIVLPWENSTEVKKNLIENRKTILGVDVDDKESLDNQLKKLDEIHYKNIFDKTINEFDINLIKKELIILSRRENLKSKFEDIPPHVRLEWLIAIITAKIYGPRYVKPNFVFDEHGFPKSHASGGKADIEFITPELYCLLEVTLIRDSKQQENSETTSISDHLNKINTNQLKCSILVAPYIHNRVVNYFKYTSHVDDLAIIALSIEYYIYLIENNKTIDGFKSFILDKRKYMSQNSPENYTDVINKFKIIDN